MSDDQIEKWNAKAKNGILRHNSDLESLVSNLKNAFFSAAGGTGKAAASIGISTGSYYSTDKGLLVLDSDALTDALESNPDEVISLFTGGNSAAASAGQGVVYKVKNALSAYQETASDSISNSEHGTEKKIDDIDDDIDELEDKLDTLAEKYYEKFSAMETALSKLNSQASYISQLFA